jgi:hypothetical protein
MSYIDEFKKIDTTSATGAAVFFFSMLGPGFLTIFLFSKAYFVNLDTLKLVLLSLSISMPGMIMPAFTSYICSIVLVRNHGKDPQIFGGIKDWYFRSAFSNAINIYLLLFASYVFNLSVQSFIWGYFVSIAFCVAFEFRHMLKKSINPEKYPTVRAP